MRKITIAALFVVLITGCVSSRVCYLHPPWLEDKEDYSDFMERFLEKWGRVLPYEKRVYLDGSGKPIYTESTICNHPGLDRASLLALLRTADRIQWLEGYSIIDGLPHMLYETDDKDEVDIIISMVVRTLIPFHCNVEMKYLRDDQITRLMDESSFPENECCSRIWLFSGDKRLLGLRGGYAVNLDQAGLGLWSVDDWKKAGSKVRSVLPSGRATCWFLDIYAKYMYDLISPLAKELRRREPSEKDYERQLREATSAISGKIRDMTHQLSTGQYRWPESTEKK